ncbi:BQ2448_3748 [Microbotryum intermedium]|uniref:BQ2448_3748 protein n=1 Tax=Microbotryum intermedium TaxID=269621 RepID=A0A238FIT7_9BASI|nr:BQ2448_3748 [Microbotryum intermedium]
MLSKVLFSTSLLVSLLAAVSAKKGLLAAYFAAYDKNATIDWEVIDIGYHFGAVTSKDGIAFAENGIRNGIEKFVSDAHSKKKKAVLSIGGYEGSVYFSTLVRTKSARAKFVKQICGLIKKYGWDGVDFDWEFPNALGSPANVVDSSDSANLLKFLQELRHTLPHAWISMAVSVNGIFGPDGMTLTDYKPFADVLNGANVMAYDYIGAWTRKTGSDSPSQRCGTGRSYITDVEGYTNAGFPPGKILLGVPSFGKSFILQKKTLHTQSVHGDQTPPIKYWSRIAQKYDNFTGSEYTYVKLKELGILEGELGVTAGKGYERHYDHCTRTPFVFNPSTKTFITYLDARSAAYRAQRSVEEKYLGVSVFTSAGFDDFVFNAIDTALKTPIGGFPSP